ncbi:SH3 domain-containing protein [Clostridium sp. K04]|uniref:SH3 domain-containing protein n=4 Tax=Clostridium TaxID=1485 RepID=UPI001C8BA50D|nr:SH3 domain-containing protein [Clostridium sp. K04]MBX9185209.1 SH3 domain-containing protein [Clostridium sp. K04]
MVTINKLKILSLLILSGILITPSHIAKAEGIYNVSESDLIKLLEKYKDEEIVLEDGLVLTVGQAINLPIDEGWTIYNENVAEIVDGELVGKSVGSTFVSQQTEDTVYILEVCITEEGISTASYARSNVKNVDRDYYKVFIDPGHGGVDNGAVQNGVLEDEINLQISKKIEAKLKAKGVEVKMSRYDDTYLSLTDRTYMANKEGSDVFVSIHQNSATNSSAKGIETYYYSTRQDSKELATDIQNDLIQATNATDRGVKTANYAVIKTASMSSSLVECGFISNPTEAQNLSSSSYQDKVAEGIVNGIMDYLNNNVILNNSGTQKPGDSTTTETVQTGTVKVSNSLNVRSGAGTNYSVLGSLSNGAKVEIVGTSGSWYKIKYGSGYGYVSKDYVTVSSSSNNSSSNSGSSNSGSSNNTTTTPSTSTTGTIKVNDTLNVRSGAGTSYSVIGSLKNGAKVEIVGTSGSWYKIKYGSGYGYVSKDYVTVSSSSNNSSSNSGSSNSGSSNNTITTPSTSTTGTIKVNDTLNVRSGAGTSYSVIGSLKNGATVEIVETSGSWYKIKYGSGYGYVSKDYVTVSSSSNNSSSNSGSSNSGSSNNTTTTPSTSTTGTIKVNNALNVRSGAGTSYSVIGSLKNGATVEIVETSGSWYKIKYGSGYGYVSKDYVTVSSSSNNSSSNSGSSNSGSSNNTTTTPSTSTTGTIKVNDTLNVRSGAGTSYSVIGSLKNGATVEIVETSGSWYKIKYGSGYGYVSKDYVTVSSSNNNSSSNNTTTTPSTSTTGTIKVNNALNVRSGAGTSYSVIGSLKNGATIEIVETVNSWYKIKFNNGYGYVSKDYVVLQNRSIAENVAMKEGTVVTVALKVRESNNFESDIIGTIAMGEKISVLEDNGEWSKISYKQSNGYILNEYVDFNIA